MKSITKSLRKTLATALLIASIAAPSLAYEDALMTLRFHYGRKVAYQDQLYYVIREAVKTKSTVVFDIVSTSPQGHYGPFGQQVAHDIIKMGVNPQQVTYRTEQSPAVQSEEVRIFVR